VKGLESGKDKIQKICDALRKETLEPAKQEAREIVENAHLQANEIIKEAEEKAMRTIASAEKEIEERKRLCQSSLQLSCRQAIEQLKQKIEEQLFNKQLAELIAKEMSDPKIIAQLLTSLMRAMENKGVDDEFIALIPKEISPKAINAILTQQILEKLEKQSVTVGDFAGGVQIRLKGRRMTIDVSDAVVRELIAQYIRRDFRDLIFSI
jgi:V/A-type H+-transporting ATPase subunit E